MAGLRYLLILLVMGSICSSCAIAPAALKEIVLLGPAEKLEEEDFGSLLKTAVEKQDTNEGNIALGIFVEDWTNFRDFASSGEVSVWNDQEKVETWHVTFTSNGPGEYPLDYFDDVRAAADFKIKRIQTFRRAGIGAPLLALRENENEVPLEKFYPPEAITRPMTAVVAGVTPKRDGSGKKIQIRLYNPLAHETVFHAGEERSLAANFTISWAGMLERAGELNKLEILDALKPDPKRDPRLYLMEAYDPQKEPVIMIHGLFSSPLIWADMSLHLWADEDFRKRHQIWHYHYNTSAPPLYSGRILQDQLRELRNLLDPSGSDPAMKKTTVIAHSMGGLVTRRLITQPGNLFWEDAFTRPMSSLTLDDQQRVTLRNAFFWEPERHIHRVIYIAVPHRGSDYADNFIGKIGRSIVKPPNEFSAFYRTIHAQNPGAFSESYLPLARGEIDSVHSLSPEQPALKRFSQLPNSHEIEVFNFLGDRGRKCEPDESSDGVVDYWSSHLKTVVEEIVLPFNHTKIVEAEETVEKLKSIFSED